MRPHWKPNLDVRRHDIARDVLPEETFDLVHVRLVLVHLPERDEVLTRIVSALKPGGWLLAEEFDSLSLQPDPVIASTEISIKTLSAMEQLMARRGVDSLYGRRLAARVRLLGFASVTAEGRLFMWEGQSKGADLTRANFEQIRNELIELGLITESEFERDVDLLAQYELLFPSPTAFTPEGIQILAAALDEAWESLRQSGSRLARPAYSRAMREVVAKRIVEMAQRGVQDRKALVADALRFVAANYDQPSEIAK